MLYMTSMQMSFHVSGRISLVVHQLSGCLVSDNLAGEEAGSGGPGLAWLQVVCGFEAGMLRSGHALYSDRRYFLHPG